MQYIFYSQVKPEVFNLVKFKKPILGVRYSKPNKTSLWLQEHLKEGPHSKLWKTLEQALKYKCGMSSRISQIEDHIQAFLEKLIRRDSLKDKIDQGLPIYYKQLAAYAVNSAKNDMRDNGSNPVCRELHGARTDTEMKQDGKAQTHAMGLLSAVKRKDNDDHIFLELVDSDAPRLMEAQVDYSDFMKELYNRIQPFFRSRTTKVLKALELFADGESKKDIYEETGIQDITKILEDVKTLIPKEMLLNL